MWLEFLLSFDCCRSLCACAVPAEANVLVTCRRLSNDEPEVIEITRDDTVTAAVAVTPPAAKGLWNNVIMSCNLS